MTDWRGVKKLEHTCDDPNYTCIRCMCEAEDSLTPFAAIGRISLLVRETSDKWTDWTGWSLMRAADVPVGYTIRLQGEQLLVREARTHWIGKGLGMVTLHVPRPRYIATSQYVYVYTG